MEKGGEMSGKLGLATWLVVLGLVSAVTMSRSSCHNLTCIVVSW